MKKNFFLFIFSIIALVLILEVLLIFFYPQNLDGWMKTRDKTGLDILRKNSYFYHRDFGRNIKYKFGNYHNRKTSEANKENKILLLGDSFPFGWLVEDKYIYPQLLQNSLPNYEIINVSVPKWGIDSYTKYLENYCKSINPDKTIVMLNTDDFRRGYHNILYQVEIKELLDDNNFNYEEIDNLFLLNYSQIKEIFKLKSNNAKPLVEISKFHKVPFYKFLLKNSNLFYLFRQSIINLKNNQFFLSQKNFSDKFSVPSMSLPNDYKIANVYGKILMITLKEIADKCGTELNIIYSGWYDYKNLPNLFNPTIYFLNEAENFFQIQGINYYDLTDKMKIMHKNPKKYIIKYDNHPNELGHKIIGENLIKLLRKQILN